MKKFYTLIFAIILIGSVVAWNSNQVYDPFGIFMNMLNKTNHTTNERIDNLAVSSVGGSMSHNNMQPYTTLNYIIALQGVYPSMSEITPQSIEPFIGEIILFAGNFAPRGWAFCDGQLLPISQNTALFSILGTTYGGDGRTTFGLPDLRGRVPIHEGTGAGLPGYYLGSRGGEYAHLLSVAEMPSHSHNVIG